MAFVQVDAGTSVTLIRNFGLIRRHGPKRCLACLLALNDPMHILLNTGALAPLLASCRQGYYIVLRRIWESIECLPVPARLLGGYYFSSLNDQVAGRQGYGSQ